MGVAVPLPIELAGTVAGVPQLSVFSDRNGSVGSSPEAYRSPRSLSAASALTFGPLVPFSSSSMQRLSSFGERTRLRLFSATQAIIPMPEEA